MQPDSQTTCPLAEQQSARLGARTTFPDASHTEVEGRERIVAGYWVSGMPESRVAAARTEVSRMEVDCQNWRRTVLGVDSLHALLG